MGFFQVGRSRRRGRDRKPSPCFVYAARRCSPRRHSCCGLRRPILRSLSLWKKTTKYQCWRLRVTCRKILRNVGIEARNLWISSKNITENITINLCSNLRRKWKPMQLAITTKQRETFVTSWLQKRWWPGWATAALVTLEQCGEVTQATGGVPRYNKLLKLIRHIIEGNTATIA